MLESFSNIDTQLLEAVAIVLLVSGVPLIVGMSISLVVCVLQAATQVQEQTLTFVPKVGAVYLTLVLCGAWLGSIVVDYFVRVLERIPSF